MKKTAMAHLDVLFRKEGPLWVAICLQHDICGQGKTLDDADFELQRMLVGYAYVSCQEGKEDYAGRRPAPAIYWAEFERARELGAAQKQGDGLGSEVQLPMIERRVAA